MPKPFVIAIDGTAASGKGTLAKQLAAHFNLPYLDTGKLYRAVAWNAQDDDMNSAIKAAQHITAKDLDNPELSREEISKRASMVATIPEVRAALLSFQQSFAGTMPGAVLDGRDIGTVICPEAQVKLFITASAEARAERRFKELQSKELPGIYNAILSDLQERDQRDTMRSTAPLEISPGAYYMDTSLMNIEEVFHKSLEIIQQQCPEYSS